MIHRGNSSGLFRWMAVPESHLGIIVLISKEYMSCQQTFNYIFQPLFHFVACCLDCRGAAIYITEKKICRVHNLEATDTVEKGPNGSQIASGS